MPGRREIAPETRWICLLVAVILLAAVILLGIRPDRTDELFAWTITPEMTPLYLASAYGAGVYFFARGFLTSTWHHIAAGFPGIALFATLMLVATLLHFDKFNGGDAPAVAAVAFYAWVIVYILSPLLVGGVWLRNRGVDTGEPDPVDTVVPPPVRTGVRVAGGAMLAAATLFFLLPQVAIDIWPWKLTPLTARIMASFIAETGAIALVLSFDARWSAWRILTQTAMLGAGLLLSGIARTWDVFDTGNPLTWAFLAAGAGTIAGAAALHVAMQRRLSR